MDWIKLWSECCGTDLLDAVYRTRIIHYSWRFMRIIGENTGIN